MLLIFNYLKIKTALKFENVRSQEKKQLELRKMIQEMLAAKVKE